MTSKKSARSIRPTSASATTQPEQKPEAVGTPRRRSASASARAPRSKKAGTPERAPRAAKPRAKAAKVVAPEALAPDVVEAARVVTDEEIRVRAYFLSLEYSGDGSDVDFWLLAERELRPDTDTK